ARAPPPTVPSYADAAASYSARRKGKGRANDLTSAAQVAASSIAGPPAKAPAPLPAAMRRFFAPRTEPLPHDNALDIAATAPNMMAALLREAACPHPVSFSAAVNVRGALTLTTNNVHIPATAYAPYYEAMAHKLNQSFPIGDNPFRPF